MTKTCRSLNWSPTTRPRHPPPRRFCSTAHGMRECIRCGISLKISVRCTKGNFGQIKNVSARSMMWYAPHSPRSPCVFPLRRGNFPRRFFSSDDGSPRGEKCSVVRREISSGTSIAHSLMPGARSENHRACSNFIIRSDNSGSATAFFPRAAKWCARQKIFLRVRILMRAFRMVQLKRRRLRTQGPTRNTRSNPRNQYSRFDLIFHTMPKANINLTETMKKLRAITAWFDAEKEIDVEKGLEKVKEGAELIKASRERLKELENEFEEVKKKLGEDA